MSRLTGKVVDGQVVIQDGTLPEGAIVDIYIHDDDVVELRPEEEAELEESLSEIERGDFVDGDEVIRRLRAGEYAVSSRRQPYELSAEEESQLEESLLDIRAGNYITAEELFRRLRDQE